MGLAGRLATRGARALAGKPSRLDRRVCWGSGRARNICLPAVVAGSLIDVDSSDLDRLRGALLVQCLPEEAGAVRELAHRPGAGMVVTTEDPYLARQAVVRSATLGPTAALLLDASRYAGNGRLDASAPFRAWWVALQRDLGLPVLTDSGYAGPRDHAGVHSVLSRAAQLGSDVVAMLALHPWWLHQSGGLRFLLEQVRAAGVPVAVALEHKKDPLGVQKTLHGLIRLLGVGVPVIQLRCDVSSLGLLCHGAWAAAVGTRSKLRHFYPVSKGQPPPAKIATVVKECLSFVDINRVALAVQDNPEDSLWRPCECPTCGYRALDWISTLGSEEEQQRAAFGHALEMLFALRDEVYGDSSSPVERQLSWRENCGNAIFRFRELEWSVPRFLPCWHAIPIRKPMPNGG